MNYLDEYRPQQESLKFFNWNNLMFGNDTNETPKMHFQLIDEMLTQQKSRKNHSQTYVSADSYNSEQSGRFDCEPFRQILRKQRALLFAVQKI